MPHMNVLAMTKDYEKYIFIYDDESIPTLLQTLARFASTKSLSFTWYDAAVCNQQVNITKKMKDAECGGRG